MPMHYPPQQPPQVPQHPLQQPLQISPQHPLQQPPQISPQHHQSTARHSPSFNQPIQHPIANPYPTQYQNQPPSQYIQQQPAQSQYINQQPSYLSGRKKALFIGINYTGTRNALAGCINDSRNLRNLVSQHYGFNDPNRQLMLTDDQHGIYSPTYNNIINAFRWLIEGSAPGDLLFLSFSGHGGRVKDLDGDREDGLDPTICPLDFKTAGQIHSDLLHYYLVTPLPVGVHLVAIMDCCHSGTLLELPFTYKPDANGKMSPVEIMRIGKRVLGSVQGIMKGNFRKVPALLADAKSLTSLFTGSSNSTGSDGYKQEQFHENKYEQPKSVICFSGCLDSQTSADTAVGGMPTGALTYAFLSTLRDNPRPTYEQLLGKLREYMIGKYSQIPQMSCGMQINPNATFVL